VRSQLLQEPHRALPLGLLVDHLRAENRIQSTSIVCAVCVVCVLRTSHDFFNRDTGDEWRPDMICITPLKLLHSANFCFGHK